MDLNTFWFLLVGILLTGYAVLDGFDLGTGPLLLCARSDQERRIFLNAIGPVWNGNEVWLVTGVGALFAAFPQVYATVFSGFYDVFMLLLAALIFRAVAIEFRSQRPGKRWRTTWDLAFAISSGLSAFLLGVAFGNIVWGIPLDSAREFQGNLLTLLQPYALLTGFTAVVLFIMHANVYLVLKTDGPLQEKLMNWTRLTVTGYLACFVAMNAMTLLGCPHIVGAFRQRPLILGPLFLAALLVTFNVLREIQKKRPGRAFASSCAALVLHFLLFGAAVYPNLVYSTPNHAYDLNIYNGASTQKTLGFMFVVAIIGVPIVLIYTITVYYIFRGKVVLTDESY
ncbi:MAG: cytochrome d ubiquinol oxidase subunit II [Verrucomicrobia bacterium]|nr:cytochrome d ubiquinol oxidase subunit II [Verrucomicrobiota bacterium]MBV8417956.1 cytochrome d ubiquinol oxidase subunit II [Verrucomicrobiota bacterium]